VRLLSFIPGTAKRILGVDAIPKKFLVVNPCSQIILTAVLNEEIYVLNFIDSAPAQKTK